jgi:hypothetical protein
MAEEHETASGRSTRRHFLILSSIGAIMLTGTAIATASADRSGDFLSHAGPAVLVLLVPALIVGLVRRSIEAKRGADALSSGGAGWRLAIAIVSFQLSLLGALVLLGVITGAFLAAGSIAGPMLLDACILLLVGGVLIAMTAGLLRDFLLVLSLRRT